MDRGVAAGDEGDSGESHAEQEYGESCKAKKFHAVFVLRVHRATAPDSSNTAMVVEMRFLYGTPKPR
jgi:hypothetical protein